MKPSRAGVLDALEEAEQLLRSVPAGWLGIYLAGAVPFAVALLFFVTDMRLNRDANPLSGPEALLVTLTFLWMNCARALCAGKLLRVVSGDPEPPWTPQRVMHLVAAQSFFPALKLVIFPIAALLTIPFAAVAAFFRNVTVFADSGAGIRELTTQARRLATWQQTTNWSLLAAFSWLWLVVLVNVAVALAMLPQLARMLFGYETVFSDAPAHLALNSTFVMVVVMTTWTMLDPLIQTCYVLRCFHGESLETGADVRAVFRRLAAALLLAVSLLAPTATAAPAISPEELDRSIERTLQAREYSWRLPRDLNPRPPRDSAFLRASDRAIEAMRRGMRAAGRALWSALLWLRDWLFGKPEPARPGDPAPSAPLRTSLTLLLLISVGAGIALLWRFRAGRRRSAPTLVPAAPVVVDVHDESLTADRLPEERWLALAEEQIAAGDLRAALRALYLGHLAWLGRVGLIGLDPCKTNREYHRELRRRARATPQVETAFAANVRDFESVWYGAHSATAESLSGFRERMAGIRSAVERAT